MNILKKFLLISVLFVLWAGVLPAQQVNLREAIARSARGVEEALPQGTMVAVLNFASPSATFTDYVIEELTGELVTGQKVAIVDRQNLALISTEMNLQLSGDVSDESAQAIGKMLGAQSIISGTLTDMGRFYRFRIRVINVETARIQTQVSLDLRKDEQVAYLLSDSQESASRQRPARSSQSDRTANVRNNWISGELSGGYDQNILLGAGVRYERMFGSKISIGASFYFGAPTYNTDPQIDDNLRMNEDMGNAFGIDALFRFYPWGRKFYLGVALGYFKTSNYFYDHFSQGRMDASGNFTADKTSYHYGFLTGFAITPEIGWKIDVGKEGGFFIQPGFAGTFISGNMTHVDSYGDDIGGNPSSEGFNVNLRFYLGMGYAF